MSDDTENLGAETMEPDDESDGKAEVDADGLTAREVLWCEAFSNPESASYGNATASAKAAGYSQPRNAGWKIRQRPHIVARLEKLHEVTLSALGKVMTDLEHTRLAALKKGDLAVAARCSELAGKRLGAFVDAHVIDLPERRKYTEAERLEAAHLARVLIEEHLEHPDRELVSVESVDVEPVGTQSQENENE